MSHTKEKTWQDIISATSAQTRMLKDVLLNSEELYQEMLELWQTHSNVDQDVANQLFGGTATSDQLQMTLDARAALVAIHNLHLASDYAAMRRVT